MKLKKITAYIQTDGPSEEVITIIPSGYEGEWVIASEDAGYNLDVAYSGGRQKQEIIEAIKEAEVNG